MFQRPRLTRRFALSSRERGFGVVVVSCVTTLRHGFVLYLTMLGEKLMILTEEQQTAVAMAQRLESFKISALAGTGKTSTLVAIAQAMGRRRGLYLAFNAAIAQEAQNRFAGTQCVARTFHSLAYRQCGYKYKSRLGARLNAGFLRRKFGIDGEYAPAIAESALRTLSRFLRTTDAKMERQHVGHSEYCRDVHRTLRKLLDQYRSMPDGKEKRELAQNIAQYEQHSLTCAKIAQDGLALGKRAWEDMENPGGETPITHDFYLREYVLSRPDLGRDFDYLLFDEAQDADPLMLSLTRAQRVPVFYVGDAFQQIYEWRGADNAMQSLDLPESTLTQSFRFGQEVADDANLVLEDLGAKIRLRGRPDRPSRVFVQHPSPEAQAIIVRTNAEAVSHTLRYLSMGEQVGICGRAGIQTFLRGYQALVDGRPFGEFAHFVNEEELREFAQTDMGQDIQRLLKLVDEHGIETLESLVDRAIDLDKSKKPCQRAVTTAHKSKGLEFSSVLVSDGMFNPKRLQHDEEKRLLYVAKTRAMDQLYNAKSYPVPTPPDSGTERRLCGAE